MKKTNFGNRDNNLIEKVNKPGKKTKHSRKKIHSGDIQKLVKNRAYDIYQQRVQGNSPGDDTNDWHQPEEELKSSKIKG
jgi:hypothetical protein